MEDVENTVPLNHVVLIVILVSVLVIFSYAAFKVNPMLSYLAVVFVLFLVIRNLFNNMEWNPLHINANILGAKGEIGALVKPLEYVGALQYECVVACKKRYVPKERRGYLNDFWGLATILTGNVNITLRGYRHDFIELPRCGTCPEGAIMYLKGFDGEIPKQFEDYKQNMDRITQLLIKQASISEALLTDAGNMSKEGTGRFLEVSRQIATAFNQLQKSQQPQMVQQAVPIANPQGGR